MHVPLSYKSQVYDDMQVPNLQASRFKKKIAARLLSSHPSQL